MMTPAPAIAIDPAAMRAHAAEAAELLRMLANAQRLLVLCHLVEGEIGVGALLARLQLSQSALSQHLAVLREAGLVRTRRAGQQVFYSLAPGPAQQVLATLHQIYCEEPACPSHP
jgi:DNA-binding transcriptional ArsR family regulator